MLRSALPVLLLVTQGSTASEARADEAADPGEFTRNTDVDAEERGRTDDGAAESSKKDVVTPKHWQLSIALNAVSRQRATFDVEPLNSGARVPGSLERTNYGPSGGPVLIEASYLVSGRLALGLMLDLGSGLNLVTVERLGTNGFQIEQSSGSFAVGPRLAYFLFPDSTLRPFGTLAFGYTRSPSKQLDQALNLTVYQGFAGAGVSYFLSPNFSLDTSVRAAYGIGSGYFLDNGILQNAGLSGSVFTLLWAVGTSGWL